MFQALEAAGNTYPVIVDKIGEGLAFYRRLSGNVTKLRDRVREILRQHRASDRDRDRDRDSEPPVEKAEPPAGPLQPSGVCVCVCACVHVFCVCLTCVLLYMYMLLHYQ